MKVTNKNYVKLLQRGNEKALEYFIEHDGWIIKSLICQKMEGYPGEQEECMNDVFLAIWQNVHKYDSTKASFTTWISAVTRYHILDYMRKLYRRKSQSDISQMELVGETDVRCQVDHYEEEAEFRKLLQGLSREDQEIFVQLFWDEMSREEISERTGMKREILYNRISRGKKRLQNTIRFEGGRTR